MYKIQRQCVSDLITAVRTAYYNQKISECSGNQKSLFQIVDKLLHRKGSTLPFHVSSEELACRISGFFVSKVDNIRAGLNSSPTSDIAEDEKYQTTVSLTSFAPASEEEIKKIVIGSSNATCSLDPIPTSFVKQHIHSLLPAITALVNESMATGIFPDTYKQALVKPLLKKPGLDGDNLKNYRPVSNLTFVSKIIEKAVSVRIRDHMTQNNLHETMQSAYKASHSTETALLRVLNDILAAVDDQQGVLLVLLDLSAAFDTVQHSTLLKRLQQRIGIKGTALQWFQSYLEGRRHSVCVSSSTSTPTQMKYGVPQGSVLGPLLFTIYTLPVGDIARDFQIYIHLYANDTQLYIFFEVRGNPSTAVQRMEACVDRIKAWMEENSLKLNDDKTDVIVIASPYHSNKVDIPTIRIGSSEISPSPSVRNLGVTFDQTLNMKEHIKKTCCAAYCHLRNIASIRRCLSEEATIKLIQAFVMSRLDSCNSLLFGIPDVSIQWLQRVQNMAARVIYHKNKYDSVTPLLKALHWLPVPQRIIYKILLLTHKALHGMAPVYLSELLIKYKPCRSLRSGQDQLLVVPQSRVQAGNRRFASAAPRLWNALPHNIRHIDNITGFKSSLKTHLFKQSYI